MGEVGREGQGEACVFCFSPFAASRSAPFFFVGHQPPLTFPSNLDSPFIIGIPIEMLIGLFGGLRVGSIGRVLGVCPWVIHSVC